MDGCTNLTEAVRMVQQLKIDGFSATEAGTEQECYKSNWTVDGYKWGINFYPALKQTIYISRRHVETRRDVSLELVFLAAGARNRDGVKASLSCRMVDPTGVLGLSEGKSVSHMFTSAMDCTSPLCFGSRSDLEALGYLKDDSLTVECTITVLKELPEPEISLVDDQVLVPSSDLHQHLGELLQKETATDVTFVVSGESFAAHKLILAARSPVFFAEFFGHMKEASSERVEVVDMEPAAFKAMLHFIYTDTVPELDASTTKIMAMHLLAAADRYGLERIKLICEGKLSGGIDVDTAATTLALAEQHGCSLLKARCVQFIIRTPANLDAVMETEGYKHLETICTLVLSDLLRAARGRRN